MYVILVSPYLSLNRNENVTSKEKCIETMLAMGWMFQVQFPALQDLFSTASRLTLGPIQPPIQWVLGPLYRVGGVVKQQGCEADHSSSAEVE
jgi:hypothetical protein